MRHEKIIGVRLAMLAALNLSVAAPCLAQTAASAPAPVMAAPAAVKTVAERSRLPPLDPANPYSAKITAAASALAETLTDRQAIALSLVRGNFGAMGAVRIAEQSVARAVESCATSNPSLAPALQGKFSAWKQAVGPALGAQQQALARTVRSGIAGDPKAVFAYLGLFDQAAGYAAQKQAFAPPTALPACQGLMASLDRTGPNMAALLAKQDWPTAQMIDALTAPRPAAGGAATNPAAPAAGAASLPHSLPPPGAPAR